MTENSTKPVSKLNPSAKSFVFSANAPVWTPNKPVAPPMPVPAPVPVPVAAPIAPVASPVVAPAPAPQTPVKSSVLKPSAREFVPNAFAAPFVPSFSVPPPVPAPAPVPVASPAAPAVPAPEMKQVADEEPATSDSSSSASTNAEPEAEDVSEEPTVEEPEPAAEEAEEVEEATVEDATAEVEEEAAEQETRAVGERIMYTIAQLLEMEPENTPMPASVVGTQVAFIKGAKDDANAEHGGAPGKGGRKESRRGERGMHRSNSSFGEGGRGGRGRGRGGRGGRGSQPEPPLEDVAPLQINEETRWKPSHAKSRLDEPEDNTEASLKEAKSILNKLSIEKFDKLSDQLIEVAVRSVDVLSGVIEMVIAKAQMEWHFSTMYASLCSKIAQTEMPAMALDENEVAQDTHKLFRKLLLTRCQKEFEVSPSKEGLEELPEEERQEKELILKRATLGHIRFVGELFKQRMLSSRIMHACVQRLFGDIQNPDEESLECLCNLLSTIGQKLESDAKDQSEATFVAQYYSIIKQLSGNSEKLCTRVRFMLQDLLDLRKNKWVARRKETKAMTIAEVHAEAAREEKAKAKASASGGSSRSLQRSASMSSTSSNSSDKRRGSRDSNSGGASAAWKARAAAATGGSTPTVDADGWETVSGGTRPKLVKSRSTASSPMSDRAPRHPSLSRNSSDGASSRNAFASLSSKKDGRDRSQSNSSRRGDKPPRTPLSKFAALEKKSSETESEEAPEDKEEKEALEPDAFKKKVKSIFEEFVELQDLDEAVQCIQELNSRVHHSLIIQQTMDIGLEKGDKQRRAVGSLLAGLYERELLDNEAFSTAVFEQLEFAEDMEIDIPLTLKYMAEMIAPSVSVGAVAPSRLVESVQHMTSNGKAAKFMALMLVALQDEAKAKTIASEIDMTPLLREDERTAEGLKALYENHQLTFLL